MGIEVTAQKLDEMIEWVAVQIGIIIISLTGLITEQTEIIKKDWLAENRATLQLKYSPFLRVTPTILGKAIIKPTPQTNLDEVNQYRRDHGLAILTMTPELCEVVKQRSESAANNFSHEGFLDAVRSLNYTKVAENLWQGNPFSKNKAIMAWEGSQIHLSNLLGDWRYGCGARKNDVWVYVFMK